MADARRLVLKPGEFEQDEDQHIYVAFGAFASHFRGLFESGQISEFGAFKRVIKRFEEEGDPEVRELGAYLVGSIQRHVIDETSI